MNDLKNHKHADEGEGSTHSVCDYIMHTMGDNAICCECSGHECQKQSHDEGGWEERLRQILGNVPHKEKARHIINLIRQEKQASYAQGREDAINEIKKHGV